MTTEQKQTIFKEFGGSATNTGSVESQVALISHRISHISEKTALLLVLYTN